MVRPGQAMAGVDDEWGVVAVPGFINEFTLSHHNICDAAFKYQLRVFFLDSFMILSASITYFIIFR